MAQSDNRVGQKEFRRKNGIENLVDILNQCYCEEIIVQCNMNKEFNLLTYYTSVFNCVMNTIIGNKRSELHFIECGGVTSTIYAFEMVPKELKRICVSILIELLSNKKSIDYWND